MSFKEKSVWIQLVIMVLVYGAYFSSVDIIAEVSSLSTIAMDLSLLVAAVIILNILGHILVAVCGSEEQTDERDRLIELKATRMKSVMLGVGVVLSMVAIFKFGNDHLTLHLLLLVLVIAEITEKTVQVFFYRRGF